MADVPCRRWVRNSGRVPRLPSTPCPLNPFPRHWVRKAEKCQIGRFHSPVAENREKEGHGKGDNGRKEDGRRQGAKIRLKRRIWEKSMEQKMCRPTTNTFCAIPPNANWMRGGWGRQMVGTQPQRPTRSITLSSSLGHIH